MSVIPSPNIWHWPDVYELENRSQDVDGAVFAALRELHDWTGRDVVDVGCGTGFHLPVFAETARSVVGVEPHRPLVAAAQARLAGTVYVGTAEALPLADASVDVVHARTAYFFGPGCEPGIVEAMRVLRPGGSLLIVDLDVTAHPYGEWMRRDLKHYRPGIVEQFFADAGFGTRRIETRWVFPDRESLRRVLAIEFGKRVAAQAYKSTPGLALEVRYRIHSLRKPDATGVWLGA